MPEELIEVHTVGINLISPQFFSFSLVIVETGSLQGLGAMDKPASEAVKKAARLLAYEVTKARDCPCLASLFPSLYSQP